MRVSRGYEPMLNEANYGFKKFPFTLGWIHEVSYRDSMFAVSCRALARGQSWKLKVSMWKICRNSLSQNGANRFQVT